jgi:hypothetical protein
LHIRKDSPNNGYWCCDLNLFLYYHDFISGLAHRLHRYYM